MSVALLFAYANHHYICNMHTQCTYTGTRASDQVLFGSWLHFSNLFLLLFCLEFYAVEAEFHACISQLPTQSIDNSTVPLPLFFHRLWNISGHTMTHVDLYKNLNQKWEKNKLSCIVMFKTVVEKLITIIGQKLVFKYPSNDHSIRLDIVSG